MELDELLALLSRLAFPLLLKRVLPNICTLSGLSREGILLDVDRPEDFLERVLSSMVCSHEGRSTDVSDRSEDEPSEAVCWLRCLSWTSRRLPGEYGPPEAGSKSWSMELASCTEPSDDVAGLTLAASSNFALLTTLDPNLGAFGGRGAFVGFGFGFGSLSFFSSTRYTGMVDAA